ncbi:hypothetical protein, partial [Burkholderia cenocepacia]|uniref:hypothetical protein n=1 Tax=Burkholderia cenocepacia TaxID=95486 RepID=UPI00406CE6D4
RNASISAQRHASPRCIPRVIALQRRGFQVAHAAPKAALPLRFSKLALVYPADDRRWRKEAARRAKPRIGRAGADRRPSIRAPDTVDAALLFDTSNGFT